MTFPTSFATQNGAAMSAAPDPLPALTNEQCLAAAERCSAEYDALIQKHGHGVRPGWVSGELARLSSNEALWLKMAEGRV